MSDSLDSSSFSLTSSSTLDPISSESFSISTTPSPDPPASSFSTTSSSSSSSQNQPASLSATQQTKESKPLILYQPPSLWGLVRGAAINVLLPFINGLMLGFGELFAHEAAFRLGWGGTKVFPSGRSAHKIGPGIEVRDSFMQERRRDGQLEDLTAME